MNVILLGAPGAGKGTQAEILSKHFSIPTISTGNIIRETLRNGMEMSKEIRLFMEAGKLIPDHIVIQIVKDRLAEKDCVKGFILDGFPRTISQAEALDNMQIIIDHVVDIEIDDEVIMERMSGRRVCEQCGSSYHLVNHPPQKVGVCDNCAGTLIQRKDDHPDTVKNRLQLYHQETEPLKEYYKEQGKLVMIKGQEGIEQTAQLILSALGV